MVSNYFKAWFLFGPGNLILRLAHSEHTLHQVLVRRVNVGSLAQVALASLRFFSQQVAFKSLESADLARAGNFESFFSAGVSLHLWHGLKFGMAKVRRII